MNDVEGLLYTCVGFFICWTFANGIEQCLFTANVPISDFMTEGRSLIK